MELASSATGADISTGPWGAETYGDSTPAPWEPQHHPAVRDAEHPCGEGGAFHLWALH